MAEKHAQHNTVLTCPFLIRQLRRLTHFDHGRHIQSGGTPRAFLTGRHADKFTVLLNLCFYGMSAHGAMDLPAKSLRRRLLRHGPSCLHFTRRKSHRKGCANFVIFSLHSGSGWDDRSPGGPPGIIQHVTKTAVSRPSRSGRGGRPPGAETCGAPPARAKSAVRDGRR